MCLSRCLVSIPPITYDTEQGTHRIPGVFIVLDLEKRGKRRAVVLEEIGGERIEILISPPAPPHYAIAVAQSAEIHWYNPTTGGHGRNLVWSRS